MSYLFLYQNYKHQLNNWDHRRKNLGSTYGQFDMPTLRKSLKDRFTIFGHGTHPLHTVCNLLGLEEKFTGHVIEIEDPKIAVWLKLNYDHISRKDHNFGRELNYIGCYQNVKVEELQPIIDSIREVEKSISILTTERHRIAHSCDFVNRFKTGRETQYASLPSEAFDHANMLIVYMNDTLQHLSNELNLLDIKRKDLKREVLNYLEDHRLS